MAGPAQRPGARGPAPQGPETGGRSLADILREAGIENPTKTGRRRRWDDLDDTGTRQRRPDAPGRPESRDTDYGRRASDLPLERPVSPRQPGERRAQYPRPESDLRREQQYP